MKKVIFRIVVFAVAIMSLSIVSKMSIGMVEYCIQMDNKKFAEETANKAGWTSKLSSQYNEAENWIKKSNNRTVQACRKYSFLPVLGIAVLLLLTGICSVCLMVGIAFLDILYIRKRYRRRRKRRM